MSLDMSLDMTLDMSLNMTLDMSLDMTLDMSLNMTLDMTFGPWIWLVQFCLRLQKQNKKPVWQSLRTLGMNYSRVHHD